MAGEKQVTIAIRNTALALAVNSAELISDSSQKFDAYIAIATAGRPSILEGAMKLVEAERYSILKVDRYSQIARAGMPEALDQAVKANRERDRWGEYVERDGLSIAEAANHLGRFDIAYDAAKVASRGKGVIGSLGKYELVRASLGLSRLDEAVAATKYADYKNVGQMYSDILAASNPESTALVIASIDQHIDNPLNHAIALLEIAKTGKDELKDKAWDDLQRDVRKTAMQAISRYDRSYFYRDNEVTDRDHLIYRARTFLSFPQNARPEALSFALTDAQELARVANVLEVAAQSGKQRLEDQYEASGFNSQRALLYGDIARSGLPEFWRPAFEIAGRQYPKSLSLNDHTYSLYKQLLSDPDSIAINNALHQVSNIPTPYKQVQGLAAIIETEEGARGYLNFAIETAEKSEDGYEKAMAYSQLAESAKDSRLLQLAWEQMPTLGHRDDEFDWKKVLEASVVLGEYDLAFRIVGSREDPSHRSFGYSKIAGSIRS